MSMTNRFPASTVAVAALALIASSLAGAATLQEQSQGQVSYISGGIGSDEAEAMRKAAANYPLTLELATPQGGPRDAYVSNAQVDISDASGKPVLDMTSQGPLVLVNLPSGVYRVAVTWNGTEH